MIACTAAIIGDIDFTDTWISCALLQIHPNFCQANAQVEESVDVSASVLPLQVFVLEWDV